MNTQINFEDNIFILNTRIRMIRDLLLLDADPDLFLGKTLDDLDFIDQTLKNLLAQLESNKRFIERAEQFHNLSETERQFMEILTDFTHGESAMASTEFPVIREKLGLLWDHAQERRKAIELTAGEEPDAAVMEPVVSSDELSELLRDLK
jgi:hypothetical protein